MLNHVTLMGRLTRDPELKNTSSGLSVTSITVACDRDYVANDGTRETDFIPVSAFRATAEFICKYFQKGKPIIIDGRLQMRNWTDKDGNKRTSAEVLADHVYFADSKKPDAQTANSFCDAPPSDFHMIDDGADSEIPF